MEKFIFGVDIGGTDTKIGLFTPQGDLADKVSIPTDSTNHGENILKDISMAAHGIFQKRFIPERGFAGVGLAAASAVKNFDYLAPCPNIDGFGGFNVAEHLMEKFNTTARIVNDANAAALGEMWAGSGKGYSNMIFVTFGTGLGGGVILGGRLLEGVNGGGGEIGHLKIYNQSKIVCGCGRTGCAETYASATGIVRAAKNLLDAGGDVIAFEDKTGLTSVYLADLFESQKELMDVQVDPFTLMKECKNSGLQDFKDESGYNFAAKDIFDLAKGGDVAANAAVCIFSDAAGRALANASAVTDPDIFVIGGGVSKAGQFLLDRVQAAFKKHAYPAAVDTAFALSSLGNDAGMYGAASVIADIL